MQCQYLAEGNYICLKYIDNEITEKFTNIDDLTINQDKSFLPTFLDIVPSDIKDISNTNTPIEKLKSICIGSIDNTATIITDKGITINTNINCKLINQHTNFFITNMNQFNNNKLIKPISFIQLNSFINEENTSYDIILQKQLPIGQITIITNVIVSLIDYNAIFNKSWSFLVKHPLNMWSNEDYNNFNNFFNNYLQYQLVLRVYYVSGIQDINLSNKNPYYIFRDSSIPAPFYDYNANIIIDPAIPYDIVCKLYIKTPTTISGAPIGSIPISVSTLPTIIKTLLPNIYYNLSGTLYDSH